MKAPEILPRFDLACRMAEEAGATALDFFRRREHLVVENKGVNDLVSEADRAVESLIRDRIAAAFPGDAILGEEQGADPGVAGADLVWVVDPIDGTDCFVHGIPVWCVSIALVRGREVEVGVVHDPNAGETFTMCRGAGAHLNGAPIRPSAATALDRGVVGVGSNHRTAPDAMLAVLRRLLAAGGMHQRNGSGALMLAYVSAGRLLGYWEHHINSWDAAAAVGLVREAGGWTNDFLANDGLLRGNVVLAAAPGVAGAMRELCSFEPARGLS